MSEDIPLHVVYQKVETKDDEEVSLKEVSQSVSLDMEESSPSIIEEKDIEKCKKSGRRFCRNACSCFGCFTFILLLIYSVVVLCVSMQFYTNVKECFYSPENVYKESSIVDRHINQIQFNVVTGYVNIHYEKRSDIFIRVWDKSRTGAQLASDAFDSGVAINNSAIIIHSTTSAFNFDSCHHASIEIFIPSDYSQELSILGNVKVGMVHIDGKERVNPDKKPVSSLNIDVTVDLGKIVVDSVISSFITLKNEIGLIKVHNSISQNTKIQSYIGVIRTYGLSTTTLDVNTQFACSKHINLNAEVADLNTRFGVSKVINPAPLTKDLDLQVNTEYGKAKVAIESSSLKYNLGTTKGKMLVKYEDEDFVCKAEKTSQSIIYGKCDALQTPKIKKMVKLEINTDYGSSKLIVERF